MKKVILPIIITLLIATILAAVGASTKGSELVALENKAAKIEEENKDLKDKIVNSSSLTQIGKTAPSLGLTSPEKYIYMTQDGIALR